MQGSAAEWNDIAAMPSFRTTHTVGGYYFLMQLRADKYKHTVQAGNSRLRATRYTNITTVLVSNNIIPCQLAAAV